MIIMVRKYVILAFVSGLVLTSVLIKDSCGFTDLKIGVVDISSVFEQYSKRKVFDKQLKDIEKRHEDVINGKKNSILLLKEEIELLDMGSDAREKKEDAAMSKSIELEVYTNIAEQSLLKKYKECFQTIYIDVCNEVERYGKENSFDIILKNEEPELKSNEISDLQFKIGIKTVLYYSKAVDITPQIIKNMNRDYSLKAKK